MKTTHSLRTLVFAFAVVSLLLDVFAPGASAGPIVYNRPSFLQNIGGQSAWAIDPLQPSNGYRVPVPPETLSLEHPVWSRDGQLIAGIGLLQGTGFTYLRGGYTVVVLDPTGQNPPKRVASLGTYFGDKAYAAFSRDKTRLVYVDGSAGWSDFYVVSLTPGSQPVLLGSLITGENDYTGTGIDWSPTGNEVITPVGVSGNPCNPGGLPVPVTALGLASVVGNTVSRQQLLTCPPVVLNSGTDLLSQPVGTKADDVHPVFSRDGKYVAFVRWTTQFGGALASNRLTSSIRILDVGCRLTSPSSSYCEREVASYRGVRLCGLSWSGDGTSLAFDAGQDVNGVPACGNLGLWVIDRNGGTPRQLQTPTASSPSWSWAP